MDAVIPRFEAGVGQEAREQMMRVLPKGEYARADGALGVINFHNELIWIVLSPEEVRAATPEDALSPEECEYDPVVHDGEPMPWEDQTIHDRCIGALIRCGLEVKLAPLK